MSARLIIGIGSGRCGTYSLTKLLNAQPNCRVGHELPNPLPWEVNIQLHDVRLRSLWRQYGGDLRSGYGDVALYYLKYIPGFIARTGDAIRVIALKRNKQETVKSYLRKLKGDKYWPFNHFDPTPNQIKIDGKPADHKFFHAYPKYPGLSLLESLERFYDDYYGAVDRLLALHPDLVRLYDTADLNTEEGVRSILTFAGIPKGSQRVQVGIQENSAA